MNVALLISSIAFLGCVGAGIYLWWPTRDDPASRSSAGAALMTGAAVALAIFLLQFTIERRFDEIERRREAARQLQDLRLQVAVAEDLEGFDFRLGRDLSGFYFGRKILRGADFRGLVLHQANFFAAQLGGAQFDEAELHGASFLSANLEGAFLTGADLIGADLTSACLRTTNLQGADLTEADLSYADLSFARYDAHTIWPAEVTAKLDACGKEVCDYPEKLGSTACG